MQARTFSGGERFSRRVCVHKHAFTLAFIYLKMIYARHTHTVAPDLIEILGVFFVRYKRRYTDACVSGCIFDVWSTTCASNKSSGHMRLHACVYQTITYVVCLWAAVCAARELIKVNSM